MVLRALGAPGAMMIHTKMRFLLVFLSIGWISGCFDERLVRFNPRTETCTEQRIHVPRPLGVDILVVVDNSGSMAAEQELLREAFPELLGSLLHPPTDPDTGKMLHAPARDLHVGVVSTDMGVGGYDVPTCDEPAAGDDGVLQHTPGGMHCAASYPDFLSYEIDYREYPDIERIENMAEDFGCLAVLGTDGCGFEQQLEAARKALVVHARPGGANAGFLREDTLLMILFVTDEEDCSVRNPEAFFDVSHLPYNPNLHCHFLQDHLHSIDRYADDLKSLRSSPHSLVLGFIVGVPPGDEACEGRGNYIGECLEKPAMQERVRPDGELLEYVCTYPRDCRPYDPPYAGDCKSEAFPGRRFVELAQKFGDNAVVQSICMDSFVPAMGALTEKLKEAINAQSYRHYNLPVSKDPGDPAGCRCLADCEIYETLTDNRPCPEKKPARDSDGDTTGDVAVDAGGLSHSLCSLPQAGSILADCGMSCNDPGSIHAKDPDREGWWYDPSGDVDGDTINDPRVRFEGVQPESGSGVSMECCSEVCPGERQCGPPAELGSRCCAVNEYCFRTGEDVNAPGLCLVREDICREYGDDAWCPGAGPVGDDPFINGLCCLDPDADGELDMIDQDGDGLEDVPAYRCRDGGCVPQ